MRLTGVVSGNTQSTPNLRLESNQKKRIKCPIPNLSCPCRVIFSFNTD